MVPPWASLPEQLSVSEMAKTWDCGKGRPTVPTMAAALAALMGFATATPRGLAMVHVSVKLSESESVPPSGSVWETLKARALEIPWEAPWVQM